jgi:hypothetical protein
MEDTTMTDPTPTRWTIDDDGDLVYQEAGIIDLLLVDLYGPATPYNLAIRATAALVQCVRDADRLQQARELAAEARRKQYGIDRLKATTVLLDFLVDGGTDG